MRKSELCNVNSQEKDTEGDPEMQIKYKISKQHFIFYNIWGRAADVDCIYSIIYLIRLNHKNRIKNILYKFSEN